MRDYSQAQNATAEPVERNLSARASSLLQRLSNVNDGLEKVISRLHGPRPSSIDNAKNDPSVPNLYLMMTRLENMLSETEGHISEIDRTI